MPSHGRKFSEILFTDLGAWGSYESKPPVPWLWVTWCEERQSALLACWRRAPRRQSFGPAGQLLSVSIQATRASTFKREVQAKPKSPLSNLTSTGTLWPSTPLQKRKWGRKTILIAWCLLKPGTEALLSPLPIYNPTVFSCTVWSALI